MTGIRVNSEVVELYNQFRFGKGGMRFFTCKLSDDMTEVVLDSTGASNSSWEDMEATLPKHECRYIFFHFNYEEEGGKRSKIVFMTWCPEGSTIKQKMLYAATNQTLKRMFEGIGCAMQACDASELCKEQVMARLVRV